MSQHDFDIANQTSSNARADINNALKALASTSSGTTAPTTTYANMLWYDTSANILKIRAEANDAWINIGYLNQSADAFRILDGSYTSNTSGSTIGYLGSQSTSTWQAGTGGTISLVSPAQVKAAVLANTTTQSTAFNAVGTYSLLRKTAGTSAISAGSTYAGSGLRLHTMQAIVTGGVVSIQNTALLSTVPSGTWRAMSGTSTTLNASWAAAALFVRIS